MTGAPIISAHDDTCTTVGKIGSVLGKIRVREQKKVAKTEEIMEKVFDFGRPLKELKLT